MGLFDNVNCKYKLPDIDISGTSLTKEELQEENYQTKDFESSMISYTFNEDGTVTYETYESYEWIDDKKAFLGGYSKGVNLQHITVKGDHVIRFYSSINKNEYENDYWIEWKALIINGVISSITLEKLEKDLNATRKENEKIWKEEALERNVYVNSLKYKYLMKFVEKGRRKIGRFLISITSFCIKSLHVVNSFIYKLL